MGEYGEIPPGLPALWAALGQSDRAESLAHSIADYDRVLASAKLAGLMGAAGELERAERLVRSIRARSGQIREPYDKAWAWSDLAWLAAISGDRDRADRLIREAYSEARPVTQPYLQAQLLLAWARVRAAGGDGSRAGALADRARALATGKLNEPSLEHWVLEALPVIVTGTGDLDRAEELVRTVLDPYHQARAAAELAVMAAALGESSRAGALLGGITDEYRHARLSDALAAIRAVGLGPSVDLYRQARALASLAEVVAAGGPGHAWGVSDWAEPLVRYSADRSDQVLIFAALAAGAAGGGGGQGSDLADRAEAIVAPITDPENQPQALVTLAWMVADAGEPARAGELANAAEALAQYTRRYLRTWRVADLAAMAQAAAGEHGAGGLPELTGTPRQREWAGDLRAAYVTRRWGTQIPAEVKAHLARFTEARWWISYRDDLDGALGEQAGIWHDENLPGIMGTPRQEEWARKLRAKLIGSQWPGGIPPRVAAALAELTDAHWWIDNRENLDAKLAELAETSRISELPEITGTPRQRKWATDIRAKVVRKHWDDRVPPGVRETLDRLTDAEWWIRNQAGDGRPGAIDRALATELPEDDRRAMAVHDPSVPAHAGPCTEQPRYAAAWRAAFGLASAFGDVRAGEEVLPSGLGNTCCTWAGFREGEKEGQQAWLDNRAAEIRRKSPGLTAEQAKAEARSDLARLERWLDGDG